MQRYNTQRHRKQSSSPFGNTSNQKQRRIFHGIAKPSQHLFTRFPTVICLGLCIISTLILFWFRFLSQESQRLSHIEKIAKKNQNKNDKASLTHWNQITNDQTDNEREKIVFEDNLYQHNDWHIDWRYLRKLMVGNTRYLLKNDITNDSLPLLNPDLIDTTQLEQSIVWNNKNYYGYCRPYFYPYLAFVHIDQENGIIKQSLTKVTRFLSQVVSSTGKTNKNDKKILFDNNTKLSHARQIIAANRRNVYGATTSQSKVTRSFDDIITDRLNDWVDKYNKFAPWFEMGFDYYNTSNFYWNEGKLIAKYSNYFGVELDNLNIHSHSHSQILASNSDSVRVMAMQKKISHYRFDSLTLTHNSLTNEYNIEIIVSLNKPDHGHNLYFDTIIRNSNMDGTKRWRDQSSEYEEINVAMENNIFLCVFNNGVTIVSSPIRRGNELKNYISHFIIECNISNYPSILDKLLFKNGYKGGIASEKRKSQSRSPLITNIGLTLFSLLYKEHDKVLYNEYLIGMNTQLPVCSTLEINRAPQMYKNSMQYHSKLGDQFHQIKPVNVSRGNSNKNSNTNDSEIEIDIGIDIEKGDAIENTSSSWNKVDLPKYNNGYNISAVTFIHPSSRSGQMEILVQQWIDYHLFQGFDHFYLFDHLFNRQENDIGLFYNHLKSYIDLNILTLIQWPIVMKFKERRNYEVSGYIDSIRRFRYDTKYLTMFDVDEWIMIFNKKDYLEYEQTMTQYEQSRLYSNSHMNLDLNATVYGKLPTMSELLQQSNDNFGLQYLVAYTSLGDIFGFWQQEEQEKEKEKETDFKGINKNRKRLGCKNDGNNDIDNSFIHYDSFIQRQSCIHYKLENAHIVKYFANYYSLVPNASHIQKNFDKYFERNSQFVLSQIRDKMKQEKLVEYRKKLDTKHAKLLPSDHTPLSLSELNKEPPLLSKEQRIFQKKLLYFDYLNEDKWWLGFQITPKLLINPLIAYCGYQHDMNLYNTHSIINIKNKKNQERRRKRKRRRMGQKLEDMIGVNRHTLESGDLYFDMMNDVWQPLLWEEVNNDLNDKYQIILLHTTDHWRTLGFYHRGDKMIDFKSIEDMRLFYTVTGSKCKNQDVILEWNERFLSSKYGQQWRDKWKVDPLFSQNGLFCYDTDPHYVQKWLDE